MGAVASRTAVLVPLKSFAGAKARLGTSLSEPQRASLMRELAGGVLHAAEHFQRFVVCDSREVAEFALTNGAQVIWRGGGLNPAVQSAADHLGLEGYERVIVSHGDLASPGSFEHYDVADSSVAIGPDRHGDGSNIVSIPTNHGYRFAYGVGSMARHMQQAADRGLACEIMSDTMGLDVDTPEDLALYLQTAAVTDDVKHIHSKTQPLPER